MRRTPNPNRRPIKFEAVVYADSHADLLKSLKRMTAAMEQEIDVSRSPQEGVIKTSCGGGTGDDTSTKLSPTRWAKHHHKAN